MNLSAIGEKLGQTLEAIGEAWELLKIDPNLYIYLAVAAVVILLVFLWWYPNPFKFPYYMESVKSREDVCCSVAIKLHEVKVEEWKKKCGQKIKRSFLFKKRRGEQYLKTLDSAQAYRFKLPNGDILACSYDDLKTMQKTPVEDRYRF